jgi:hypothetical protein
MSELFSTESSQLPASLQKCYSVVALFAFALHIGPTEVLYTKCALANPL